MGIASSGDISHCIYGLTMIDIMLIVNEIKSDKHNVPVLTVDCNWIAYYVRSNTKCFDHAKSTAELLLVLK